MPVPSSLSDLSQTAGSNYPTGGESPITTDDYFRAHASFFALLRDGKGHAGEVDVASASTCDIGAANSLFVRITGTTAITSFGTNYNGPRFLRFAAATTLAHSASLVMPGATSIITEAGDTCIAVPISGGWAIYGYQSGVPGLTGEIKMWPTVTAPSGFLLCTGAAVSRTTYARLFSVIGATFGGGDGSTTFNLPNYVDRMPIGAGNLYAIGGTGGSKDAVVVSHTHTATDSGHTHNTLIPSNSIGNNGQALYSTSAGNTNTIVTQTASANISVSTTGSSGTNANLPPYIGNYFIIKT